MCIPYKRLTFGDQVKLEITTAEKKILSTEPQKMNM